MYTILIQDKDFTTDLTKLFVGNDFKDLFYSRTLMKAGGCSFVVELRNSKVNTTNFKLFNRVTILRQNEPVFIGYMENFSIDLNTMVVTVTGILNLFKRRLYSADIASEDIQVAVESSLTYTNGEDDTGISYGGSDVTYTVVDIKYNRSNILSVWNKYANLSGAEYDIDNDKKLYFNELIGQDKTDTIQLGYNINFVNLANIVDYNVDIEGKEILNRVIGLGSNNITAVEESVSSKSEYGLLEGTANFYQTEDATDLQSETENYVGNYKEQFLIPRIQIDTDKVDHTSIKIGDRVSVAMNNGYLSFSGTYRVLKKQVRLMDSLQEIVTLEVAPNALKTLPKTFIEDIVTLEDKISLIESEI